MSIKIDLQGNVLQVKNADAMQFTVIKSWNKMKWDRKLQALIGIADIELLDKLASLVQLPPEAEKRRRESHEFLLISSQHLVRKIPLKDIVYMEARGRILTIHTLSDIIETYEQIGLMEKRLREKDFFRCHKGFLVNLRYVDTYDKTQIYTETKDTILLAKRRYDDFAMALMHYLKKEGGLA